MSDPERIADTHCRTSSADDDAHSRIEELQKIMTPQEARDKLALWRREDARFVSEVDRVLAAKPGSGGRALALGETPAILRKFGAQNYNLTMTPETLAKISGQTRDGHFLTAGQIKSLPQELREPLALLQPDPKNASHPRNSFVALTEMTENGAPIIAAVHLEKREGRVLANRVASVYGKERLDFYQPELLLYVEKKRGLKWFQSAGLQLPLEGTASTLTKNIHTEDSVVNHPK